jgi:hypothetical protein
VTNEALRTLRGAANCGPLASQSARRALLDAWEFPSGTGSPVCHSDQRFQIGEDERAVPVLEAEHCLRPRAVVVSLELVEVNGEGGGRVATHRGDDGRRARRYSLGRFSVLR